MSFDQESEIDVSNISLRNYFQNKILDKEPTLILKQKTKNIDAYSRVCQSNQRRQPVILTKEELKRIQEKYPEYNRKENYLEYGTNPDNPYYYICPKYWNIKTGTPVSEMEMNEKKLHNHIIPANAKSVPANAYIYKFVNDKDVHYQYPNFIPDRHPDGYYLPCCFQDYETTKRKKVRDEVERQQNEYKNKEIGPDDASLLPLRLASQKKIEQKESPLPLPPRIERVEETESNEYIKSPDKFPLDIGRWGQLPPSIQKLLEHDNNECQISNTNMRIKPDHPCLLRHGVRHNTNKSFLECIADIVELSSINILLDEITDNLDFDLFLLIQNGNLVTDFYNPTIVIPKDTLSKCRKSKFYNKLTESNEEEMEMFNRACIAYTNFIEYLYNKESYVDYTYLWDLVSLKYQFRLCIFEIVNNDLTDNVEILCPSNHYSRELISSTEDSMVMIIKKGDYYEPIYMYTKHKNGKIQVENRFSSKTSIFKSVIKILKRIFTFMQNECTPRNIIYAKQSPSIYVLLDVLNEPNYTILGQVVNYDSKAIGLFVSADKVNISGYIPCHPTGILHDFFKKKKKDKKEKDKKNEKDKKEKEKEEEKEKKKEKYFLNMNNIFMFTDSDIYSTYQDTLDFYKILCSNTRGKLPCRLIYKLVEDEHVVGFLTETDQLVPINPPVPITDSYQDNLPIFDSFIPTPNLEKELILTDATDDARTRYVNEVKNESAQYFIFRNIVKMVLKDSVNNKLSVSQLIREKEVDVLVEVLKEITENKIIFVDKKELPLSLDEISFLGIRSNEPIFLLKKKNNNERYYVKLADELVRNSRLQHYILYDASPVILNKDNYEINSDEIMLNESMLMNYYDSLEGTKKPRFNKYDSYDNVDPYNYKELVEKDEYHFYKENSKEKKIECKEVDLQITTAYVKKIFDPKKNIMNTYDCVYGIISTMLPGITDNEIRETLVKQYKSYGKRYMDKIINVLNFQGKKKLIEDIITKKRSIEYIIFSENYFLTTLDIWMLCLHYRIPVIFVSLRNDIRSNLMETFYNEKMFLAYGSKNDDFYFVGVPGHTININKNKKQKPLTLFSRILSSDEIEENENRHLYKIDTLLNPLKVEKCFDEHIDIETFLENFYRPKQKAKKDKESDEDDI